MPRNLPLVKDSAIVNTFLGHIELTGDDQKGELHFFDSAEQWRIYLRLIEEGYIKVKEGFFENLNMLYPSNYLGFPISMLASGFGLPIMGDISSQAALTNRLNYQPITDKGTFGSLAQDISDFSFTGVFFEKTANLGNLIYQGPWWVLNGYDKSEVLKKNGFFPIKLMPSAEDYFLLSQILETDEPEIILKFIDVLSILAGVPTHADKNGLEALNSSKSIYQQSGIIDTYIELADEILGAKGNSGAEVDIVYVKDILFAPDNTGLLHITEQKKMIRKKIGDRESYSELTPAEEYLMYRLCEDAGINMPNTRLILDLNQYGGSNINTDIKQHKSWLLVDFVEGIELNYLLENLQGNEIVRIVKKVYDAGVKIHSALGTIKHDEVTAKLNDRIKEMYSKEWQGIFSKASSEGLDIKLFIESMDNYFEKLGFKKQILADFSPCNIRYNLKNDEVYFYDKAYPAFDFTPMDFSVLLSYNPNMDKSLRHRITEEVVLKDKDTNYKNLIHYSFFKKNIYGYFLFKDKNEEKAKHRLKLAVENFDSLMNGLLGINEVPIVQNEQQRIYQSLNLMPLYSLNV